MSKQLDIHEKKSSDWRIILVLFLIAFFTRIPLINWYSAEYTDAIQQITVFYNDIAFWPPLYGTLITLLYDFFEFIPDYETAGRFISILSGSLCVIPIYMTGRYIFNEKTGTYAVLLYIFSAVALRWDLRTMSDSLFTLLFLTSIYFHIKFYYEPQRRWLFLGFFIAGLASLTRYQGLALLPFTAFLWLREIKEKRPGAVLVSLLGVLPWLVLLWWVFSYRGFGHIEQYQDRYTSFMVYAKTMKAFLILLPYALTYPVFALFCYGAYKAWKLERGRAFLLFFAALFVPWLFIHTTFRSLQSRYFMPLFPFFMIFAAYGIIRLKRERAVLAVCLVVSIVFSAAVLYYQRDSFGDIKRAAQWVRLNVSPEVSVYSTDTGSFKSKFWARRDIKELKPETVLHPGDYLVLNSFYVSIEDKIGNVGKKFNLEILYETTSIIVPLLPDLTSSAKYTSVPDWRMVKYDRHEFRSVVLKILERKMEQGSVAVQVNDRRHS